MAWQYLEGEYKNIAIVVGDTIIDDGSEPKTIAQLFDDQKSAILSNPYGNVSVPTHMTYNNTNPAGYAEIIGKDTGAFNYKSWMDNLAIGGSAYIYNTEIGDGVRLRFTKTTSNSITLYAEIYGQSQNIGTPSISGGSLTYVVGPHDSFGFVFDYETQRAAWFVASQRAYVVSGTQNQAALSITKQFSTNANVQNMTSAVLMAIFRDRKIAPSGNDPYSGGGYSDEDGGNPDEQNFDEESDVIEEPTLPTFTATGSGMVTAYVPTLSEMNDISDYLIDPNIIQALAGAVLKLSDVIIGLNLFPFVVPASQSKVVSLNLMGARLGTGITCHYADQQFITLDMGSIQIEKCWDNCLDYNPYTRITIFLPFCGYYELDTDEVMGKTVGVKYKVDIMTGSCVALVIVDGSVMYQFAGQCASQIPVSSVSFDGMISSMIDLGMTVASAQAAVGGAAAAAEDAEQAFMRAKGADNIIAAGDRMLAAKENVVNVKGAAGRQLMGATANAILSSKGFYSHAGGLSSAPGFLGVRKPFIIKKIPRQSVPEGYGKMRGYPSNIKSKLGDLSGYTEVEEIQLNIPNATVAEIAECERILKAGCYL